MKDKTEVLLKVENLCQYFKIRGGFEHRAVDGVSFEINKGEVMGLVGESGCGKTTTGRSIIKLYRATSGNVWLKGQRVVAGTRSYLIERTRLIKQMKADIAKLKKSGASQNDINFAKSEFEKKLEAIKNDIKAANYDQFNCDNVFSKMKQDEVNAKFLPLLKEKEEVLLASPAGAINESAKAEYNALKKQYLDEIRIAKKEKLITQIQMIFQDPVSSLDPRMTVREIIAEGLVIKGMRNRAELNRRVNEALEMVGLLPEHGERYQHEFSGGQRQRIGIARSLVMQPELLIADEPVSALDVSIQAQIITLLNELREKFGLTILFIAHDISVVKYFSDKIAVMYYGKIMEMASTEELFKHPMHPYTKALLSAVPYPDPLIEKKRKRITYDPREHDYQNEIPLMREIAPGHIVSCSEAEFERYKIEYEEQERAEGK